MALAMVAYAQLHPSAGRCSPTLLKGSRPPEASDEGDLGGPLLSLSLAFCVLDRDKRLVDLRVLEGGCVFGVVPGWCASASSSCGK